MGDSLERAQLRGPFQLGVRGVVRLKEQPERTFEIVDCVSLQEYTDLRWLFGISVLKRSLMLALPILFLCFLPIRYVV